MSHPDLRLISQALKRRPQACRTLIARLTPPIQRQVNGALIRAGQARRQDVRDLVQEVFRILLDQDGKVLKAWQPDRGASLEGYVGLVAQRQVVSILRSGRKSGYAEDPKGPEVMHAEVDGRVDPEVAAIQRQSLERVLDKLRANLTPQGLDMFVRLYVEERDVSWFKEHYGMKRDAVYAWRSRLSKAAKNLADKNSSDAAPTSRSYQQEIG